MLSFLRWTTGGVDVLGFKFPLPFNVMYLLTLPILFFMHIHLGSTLQ